MFAILTLSYELMQHPLPSALLLLLVLPALAKRERQRSLLPALLLLAPRSGSPPAVEEKSPLRGTLAVDFGGSAPPYFSPVFNIPDYLLHNIGDGKCKRRTR